CTPAASPLHTPLTPLPIARAAGQTPAAAPSALCACARSASHTHYTIPSRPKNSPLPPPLHNPAPPAIPSPPPIALPPHALPSPSARSSPSLRLLSPAIRPIHSSPRPLSTNQSAQSPPPPSLRKSSAIHSRNSPCEISQPTTRR